MVRSSVMLAVVLASCSCIVTTSQVIPHCMENYEAGPFGPSGQVPVYARAEARVGLHRAGDADSEVLGLSWLLLAYIGVL